MIKSIVKGWLSEEKLVKISAQLIVWNNFYHYFCNDECSPYSVTVNSDVSVNLSTFLHINILV
jgi:hypothetical protein